MRKRKGQPRGRPFCIRIDGDQVPASHFFMKLVLAAPASFLPSEPTALASQESWLHFFMNEVLAAPASGLPSLPMAFISQDASWAKAEPAANVAITAAKKIRFIVV